MTAPHDPTTEFDKLDPTRLLEIAEIALQAAAEVADYTGAEERPYPADLMGSPLQPDSLAEFTRFEVEQASEFLWRLGEVADPSANPKL